MYYHKKTIRKSKSLDLNSVFKLDLPETGLLSGLWLKINGTQAASYGLTGGDWRLIDKISKIEIIANGSNIIKSFSGKEAQNIGFLDTNTVMPDAIRNYSTNTQYAFIPISFGRNMFDKDMFLNLRNYDNVELSITNDATTSHFSAIDATIVGIFLEPENEIGSGLGYIRSEVFREWTTVADEKKYHDLPTDLMIRRILLEAIPDVDAANISETAMSNVIYDIELYLRTGAIEVYKGDSDTLIQMSGVEQGVRPIVGGLAYVNADKGFDIGIGHVKSFVHGSGSLDGAGSATIPTSLGSNNNNTQSMETYEADSPIEFLGLGECYHNILPFRFDRDTNPSSWLNPELDKVVQLNVQTRNAASAADGTAKILLERLVRP